MKNNTRIGAFALIFIGLLGMAGYQVFLHLPHPKAVETDFVHGIWFGICFGLEILGLYCLSRNKPRLKA